LMPDQVEKFFVDLRDPAVASAICLVHSRYSTNTFPTWDRGKAFRLLHPDQRQSAQRGPHGHPLRDRRRNPGHGVRIYRN
jgi:glutamate synthase domain-containing protein 1